MTSTAREVLAGFGRGALGCAVWLLGMVAMANPHEAKVAAAWTVSVFACVSPGVVGTALRRRGWR